MLSSQVMFAAQVIRAFAFALCGGIVAISSAASASAECSPPSLGEGRVADIIDGRSFRLTDGREIRLAGIETAPLDQSGPNRAAALAAVLSGHDVSLRGEDDGPDRYGRQTSYVFLGESLVQEVLVSAGQALVSADIADRDCGATLKAAEEAARQARRGTWAGTSAIKNAESPDDILAGIGQFAVVEGKVLSVRQAGATTYLNFGRNWTRDFAATIPKRVAPAFAAAGIALKSLENRRIRVRGWVEARTGPRIDVEQVGQIELLGAN